MSIGLIVHEKPRACRNRIHRVIEYALSDSNKECPMAFTAEFPAALFTDLVTGYRVSACFTKQQGFLGQFYVYVQVRVDAATKPGTVDLGNQVKSGGDSQR